MSNGCSPFSASIVQQHYNSREMDRLYDDEVKKMQAQAKQFGINFIAPGPNNKELLLLLTEEETPE